MAKQCYRIVGPEAFELAIGLPEHVEARLRSVSVSSIVTIYLDEMCSEIGRKVVIPETAERSREVIFYLRAEFDPEPVLGPLFV